MNACFLATPKHLENELISTHLLPQPHPGSPQQVTHHISLLELMLAQLSEVLRNPLSHLVSSSLGFSPSLRLCSLPFLQSFPSASLWSCPFLYSPRDDVQDHKDITSGGVPRLPGWFLHLQAFSIFNFSYINLPLMQTSICSLTKHREQARDKKFKQELSDWHQAHSCLNPALSPTALRHRPMDPDTRLLPTLSSHVLASLLITRLFTLGMILCPP